jgi:SAM-dependent methyltransferase
VMGLAVPISISVAQIFREMHRVLKPGGTAIMSFSNRCFPTKGEWPARVSVLPPCIWGQDCTAVWAVQKVLRPAATCVP